MPGKKPGMTASFKAPDFIGIRIDARLMNAEFAFGGIAEVGLRSRPASF
jgi:hypothetical protein